MNEMDLKNRTKRFALRVMKLVQALPDTPAGRVIAYQLTKAGTSVGANYRAACRGRSRAEFVSKLGIVIEEADESGFWLELIIESSLLKKERVEPLLNEVDELVRIFVASRLSAQRCADPTHPRPNRISKI